MARAFIGLGLSLLLMPLPAAAGCSTTGNRIKYVVNPSLMQAYQITCVPPPPSALDQCSAGKKGCAGSALNDALNTDIKTTQGSIADDSAYVTVAEKTVEDAQRRVTRDQSTNPPSSDLQAAQSQLAEDQRWLSDVQTQLSADQSQLVKLQTQLAVQSQAASNGATTVAGGGGNAAAPEDIAKLTGSGGAQGLIPRSQAAGSAGLDGTALAPPSASALVNEAGMITASMTKKGASSPDLLSKPIALMGGGDRQSASARAAQNRVPDLVSSAASKLKMGDIKGALQDALQTIKDDPSNPLGYVRAAEAYNKLGDWANGEKMAREALRLDPNNPNAWKSLAWSLLKQGKYKEALEAALMAAKLKPDMAEAWAIAAYASERLGNHAAVLDYLTRAAGLDPRFKDQLAAAQRGEKVYSDDYNDQLAIGGPAKQRGFPRAALAGGALAVGALAGGFVLWRRRRPTRIVATLPLAPTSLGKYQLGAVIGRGGMGEVFLATDGVLGRQVAVKKMTKTLSELGSRAREQFMSEARTVAQLQHPAIVDIYDVVEAGGDVYLVFELVRGKTAYQLLAESGKLPLTRAKEILAPVCEALDYAHGRQLVHRDLKPANIMVTEQGRIKLMDFGLARSLASVGARQPTAGSGARTPGVFARTQHAVGTPAYMAPEAETGMISKEGDVFSLGVTLYELLTGQLPFGALATGAEKSAGKFAAPSALVAGLPKGADDVVARALKPDPRERFRSAGEFAAALGALS